MPEMIAGIAKHEGKDFGNIFSHKKPSRAVESAASVVCCIFIGLVSVERTLSFGGIIDVFVSVA